MRPSSTYYRKAITMRLRYYFARLMPPPANSRGADDDIEYRRYSIIDGRGDAA